MINEKNAYKLVLASESPRRKEILERAGFDFDIWPSQLEEKTDRQSPEEVCRELSKMKAMDVASQIKVYEKEHPDIVCRQNIIVIGADTVVSFGGQIFGKPGDEKEAFRMLEKLSGKEHSVYTGVSFVIMSAEGRVGEYGFFEETRVSFYDLEKEEIEKYIATGSCMDKAGAYGIQDMAAKFVKKIDGDFYNVVGLPIGRICFEMKELGIKVL